MRKVILLLLSAIIFVSGYTIFGKEQFPTDNIKGIEVVELNPSDSMAFNDYVQKDLQMTTEYDWWSTLHHQKLPKLTVTTVASSTLNNSDSYKSANICDGKAETAWVPGIKGGIGEWIKIGIDAHTGYSVTSTPFSVIEIGVIPGYAKSSNTWSENNRVKKLLVIIYSPQPSFHEENEWAVFRLNLNDENKLQVFRIPHNKIGINELDGMKKVIWIKIEDIYKGTKYDDTCISEFVAVGRFSS